jgi:hypothetical protein
MSADELLRNRIILDKISEILKMSHPFWTVDEIKICQRGNTGKDIFLRCLCIAGNFIAKGLKENFSNMIIFQSE